MRTFIIVLILLTTTIVHAQTSQTYGFAQFEAKADASGFVPTIDGLLGKTFWKTKYGDVGFGGFFLVTDGWAEVYFGPNWSPIPELTIGLSVGMEAGGETLPRLATSLLADYEKFSFVGVVEFNSNSFDGEQTGLWYKLVATGQATDWLKLGIEWRRFAGLGPHADVTIPQTPIGVWVSWVPIEPEGLDGKSIHLNRFLFGTLLGF